MTKYVRAVSIHAPAWGATLLVWAQHPHKTVSIHAPAWGATSSIVNCKRLILFQSTHPHGVRLLLLILLLTSGCFNPRTRMGCDVPASFDRYNLYVSIHAPAWGATIRCCYLTTCCPCFNPRTRMGCDYWLPIESVITFVSIHAPAWGATYGRHDCECFSMCFNPRTRMGCDLTLKLCVTEIWGFNPRTRMGCDRAEFGYLPEHRVSIHAPAWGATYRYFKVAPSILFQSTHPHGVRLYS